MIDIRPFDVRRYPIRTAFTFDLEDKMRRLLAALLVQFLFSGPAFAWNEKGHYVVCRLAWLQMTDQQRGPVRAPESLNV